MKEGEDPTFIHIYTSALPHPSTLHAVVPQKVHAGVTLPANNEEQTLENTATSKETNNRNSNESLKKSNRKESVKTPGFS